MTWGATVIPALTPCTCILTRSSGDLDAYQDLRSDELWVMEGALSVPWEVVRGLQTIGLQGADPAIGG